LFVNQTREVTSTILPRPSETQQQRVCRFLCRFRVWQRPREASSLRAINLLVVRSEMPNRAATWIMESSSGAPGYRRGKAQTKRNSSTEILSWFAPLCRQQSTLGSFSGSSLPALNHASVSLKGCKRPVSDKRGDLNGSLQH